jgi:hypothetical protein
MDFKNFSIARDLLCLSGAFVGIALGYLLSLFRGDITLRSRNRRITLILLFFSGALVSFSAAILVSHGAVFGAVALFAVAAIAVPVFALAVCFPRAAAFPLILASGLLVVWLGYSYLRFPPINSSSVPVIFNEGGSYSIKFPFSRGNGDRAVLLLPSLQSQSSLEFQGTRISFGKLYPIIGGTERGAIGTIRQDGKVLYTDPLFVSRLLKAYYSLLASVFQKGSFAVTFQTLEGKIPMSSVPDGANLTISFDRGVLSFNPSWESGR